MHESDRRLSLLGFLIDDVSRLHRKTVDRALKLMGLTESQCRVLASLARDPRGAVVHGDLAAVVGIGEAALTGLVKRLAARGLVERIAVASDRRFRKICITPKGLAALAGAQHAASTLDLKPRGDVTESDTAHLEALLREMRRHLVGLKGVNGLHAGKAER